MDEREPRRFKGAVLLGLAVLINEWTVGRVLAEDGSIDDGFFRTALLVFDLGLVLWSIAAFRGKPWVTRRKLLFGLGSVALVIALLELGLRFLVPWLGVDATTVHARSAPAIYGDQPWVAELFQELDEDTLSEQFHYHPFLGWSMQEVHGRHINTSADGSRLTWNPEDLAEDAAELYVFGGSTVWGFGARDEFTLPSHLSRSLDAYGHDVEVVNRGELAYTFLQGVVQLLLLLRDGHRPDYVVFYDGVNDVYASHARGEAGGVIDVLHMTGKGPKPLTGAQHFRIGARRMLEEHSMLVKIAGLLRRKLAGPEAFGEAGTGLSDDDRRRLARRIADDYGRSLALVEDLSRLYGFRYLAFWQPVAFVETELSEEERVDPRLQDQALGELHALVRDELLARSPAHFFDLTEVLAARAGPVYLDYCHLSEEGNRVVAEVIAARLEATTLVPRAE